jgi:hypothetical protein
MRGENTGRPRPGRHGHPGPGRRGAQTTPAITTKAGVAPDGGLLPESLADRKPAEGTSPEASANLAPRAMRPTPCSRAATWPPACSGCIGHRGDDVRNPFAVLAVRLLSAELPALAAPFSLLTGCKPGR